MKNLTLENRRKLFMYSKNVPDEWNVHQEIFSHIQVIENARQYLLLRTVCFTENSRCLPL